MNSLSKRSISAVLLFSFVLISFMSTAAYANTMKSARVAEPEFLMDLSPEVTELLDIAKQYLVVSKEGVSTFDYSAAKEAGESDFTVDVLKNANEFGRLMRNSPLSARAELNSAIAAIAFPYYGNWCGPGYSGPKDPIDALDALCQSHDFCYVDYPSSCLCDRLLLGGTMAIYGDLTGTAKTKAAGIIAFFGLIWSCIEY